MVGEDHRSSADGSQEVIIHCFAKQRVVPLLLCLEKEISLPCWATFSADEDECTLPRGSWLAGCLGAEGGGTGME